MNQLHLHRIAATAMIAMSTLIVGLSSVQGATAESHCVVLLDASEQVGASSSPNGATCFERFTDAIAFATSGSVELSRDAGPVDLTQDVLDQSAEVQSSTVIGMLFDGANHSGATYIYTTSNPRGCLDGASFAWSYVGSAWNDRTSSAMTYQGCRGYLFEHVGFAGSYYSCVGTNSCYTLGVMDNRTSSVKFTY